MPQIPIEDAIEILEMEGYHIDSYPEGITLDVPDVFTPEELYELIMDVKKMNEEFNEGERVCAEIPTIKGKTTWKCGTIIAKHSTDGGWRYTIEDDNGNTFHAYDYRNRIVAEGEYLMLFEEEMEKERKEAWEMTRWEWLEYILNKDINRLKTRLSEGQKIGRKIIERRIKNYEDIINGKIRIEDLRPTSDLGEKVWGILVIHRKLVEQALKEGKPVPPEVLKDYPDLAEEYEEAEEPKIEKVMYYTFDNRGRKRRWGRPTKIENGIVRVYNPNAPKDYRYYEVTVDEMKDWIKKGLIWREPEVDEKFKRQETTLLE